MARYNFFERMEREIDFQTEYEKIDYIILNERIRGIGCLEDEIEKFFRSWKYKENYASFWELREEFDFCYEYSDDCWQKIPIGTVTNLEEFLLYCEMILNMFYGVIAPRVSQFGGTAEVIKKIVKEMFFLEAFQKSETWAQDELQDLEDFIEEQGIYIRQ